MKKEKAFERTRYGAEALSEAFAAIREAAGRGNASLGSYSFRVDHDDATWHYDSAEEFLADYRKYRRSAYASLWGGGFDLSVSIDARATSVSVKAPDRVEIERVFGVFEKYAEASRLPEPPAPPASQPSTPVVFIGHGRSDSWRDLKDHLREKHGVEVEAYETGARAGHTIRDVLEQMAAKSSFAILVMTAEDEQADGSYRARQNVIHEAGLFQGRLGFARAILLLEEGVEEFSNVQGVQYIRFGRGNIKETFGEILATLRREFQH